MRAAGKPWRPIILKCLRPRSFYDSEEKYKAAIAGFKKAVCLRLEREKESRCERVTANKIRVICWSWISFPRPPTILHRRQILR